MVSDVAHELRTPLGNIRGWLEAAQDGVGDLDQELVGVVARRGPACCSTLVDDLQDLALADAGQLRLHPEQVDAADLLDQVRRPRPRDSCAGEPAGSDLDADPVRLRQVVGNLVTNAFRLQRERRSSVTGRAEPGQAGSS